MDCEGRVFFDATKPTLFETGIMMKRLLHFAIPMILLVHPNLGFGQEDAPIIGGEGNAIVIEAIQDDGGVISNRMQVMTFDATNMDHGIFVGDSPFEFGFGDGDSMSMLNNPSVQKDLELVDDQMKRINDINKEFSKQIQDQMKNMHGQDGVFSPDHAKDLGQMIRDLKEQQKAQLNEVLLPQQLDRLNQVALQMQMKSRGMGGLLAGKLAAELGITADQTKRIKERQKQLQKELEEKIANLRDEARQTLLEELTRDQRKKLEELIGEKFESKPEDFKSNSPRFQFQSGDRKDF